MQVYSRLLYTVSFGLVLALFNHRLFAETSPPSSIVQLQPAWTHTTGPGQTGPLSYTIATYNSDLMGQPRTYGVVLPPGYNAAGHQRYPVILLLHGGHGGPTDWLQPDKGNALATLQQLYQAGRLPPSIVITPDGNDHRGSNSHWDPQYRDGPYGPVLTALGRELVQVIKTRYLTLPDAAYWAIGGLSSGGWGALNIGLHFPDQFGVLFSHSGYYIDRSGPQNSPINQVRTLSTNHLQRLHIYLDTGTSDRRYLAQTIAFHQELDALHVAHQFSAFPGAHTWRFWRQHLADSLSYVGTQFQQASLTQISQRH